MRNIFTLIFLGFTVFSFGQKKILDSEKYKDCQIIIPIKHGKYNQETDKIAAKQLQGKEIIVIDTKSNGEIKSFNRGFIGIYSKSDAMATYFEPTESVISLDKKYTVYLLYNNRNTYCYDAVCYDQKNGKEYGDSEIKCESLNDTASIYFGNGVLALENERYDLAIKWLNAAVKKDSTFCDAWAGLGVAYQNSNDRKGALVSYMEATSLDSTDYNSWINLQTTFWAIGDTVNALTALQRFQKSVPENDYSYNKLYDYYKSVGDTVNIGLIKDLANKNSIKIEE